MAMLALVHDHAEYRKDPCIFYNSIKQVLVIFEGTIRFEAIRRHRTLYRWVKEHANDADVWLYGQSLGTFAAVELGTRLCAEPRPRGVLLEAPPASLLYGAMTHPAAKAFHVFPKKRPVLKAALWEKIGNVCLPMLIMHGDRDDMIQIEQGKRLPEAARVGGVDAEFFKIEKVMGKKSLTLQRNI